jgi:ribose transport system substrate-binding protein
MLWGLRSAPLFNANVDLVPFVSFALRRKSPFMLASFAHMQRLWVVTATVALLGFVGCAPSAKDSASLDGSGAKTAGKGGKLRIGVIPKGTSHQFWRSVHAGAEAAAKELGDVEVLWKGPETEADTTGQISVVKNFITNRVDGIVLAPNHSQALVDVVEEAKAEKIPVVIFDSGLAAGTQVTSYVATDNLRGGQMAGKALAEAMGHQGAVVMLRYKEGSESTEQREKGFLDAIKDEPNIKVLSSDQYAGTSTESALEAATNVLNKYRDEITGIFAVCEPNCNGTLEALVQTGMAGKVKFVGFDSSESLIKGLGDKSVAGIVLQDPFEMGKQSVLAIVSHLQGKKVEAYINTGEYVATSENQNTPPFDRLLRPEQFGQ